MVLAGICVVRAVANLREGNRIQKRGALGVVLLWIRVAGSGTEDDCYQRIECDFVWTLAYLLMHGLRYIMLIVDMGLCKRPTAVINNFMPGAINAHTQGNVYGLKLLLHDIHGAQSVRDVSGVMVMRHRHFRKFQGRPMYTCDRKKVEVGT